VGRHSLHHLVRQLLNENEAADEQVAPSDVLLELRVVLGVAQLLQQVADNLEVCREERSAKQSARVYMHPSDCSDGAPHTQRLCACCSSCAQPPTESSGTEPPTRRTPRAPGTETRASGGPRARNARELAGTPSPLSRASTQASRQAPARRCLASRYRWSEQLSPPFHAAQLLLPSSDSLTPHRGRTTVRPLASGTIRRSSWLVFVYPPEDGPLERSWIASLFLPPGRGGAEMAWTETC